MLCDNPSPNITITLIMTTRLERFRRCCRDDCCCLAPRFQGTAQSQPQPSASCRRTRPRASQRTRRFRPGHDGRRLLAEATDRASHAREQASTFLLPAGYRMEFVASDPEINNPRLSSGTATPDYVSEFRSYMRDADATGSTSRRAGSPLGKHQGRRRLRPAYRVRRHVLFPRMILPIDKTAFSPTNAFGRRRQVLRYQRRRQGRQARCLLYGVGVGRDGNVEHEQSGFIWGLDNWICSTYNSFRFAGRPMAFSVSQRHRTVSRGV